MGNTEAVRKTTLEVDEALFRRAREVLGTHGLKATVHRAFEEILAADARRRAVRQLREMDGLDLDRPDVHGRRVAVTAATAAIHGAPPLAPEGR